MKRAFLIVALAGAGVASCRPTPASSPGAPAPSPAPAPDATRQPEARRPDPGGAPHFIIPAPASFARNDGSSFRFGDSTRIVLVAWTEEAAAVANRFAASLRPATGFMLTVSPDSFARRTDAIRMRMAPERTELGEEGYELITNADSIQLTAATAVGLYRGTQTLRLLLPFGIEAENSIIRMGEWVIPAVRITDRPRFAWRGAMLDVSRHFFTVDEVKQYIDILALYKLNVLHLHLADDQGWRIEIKSRPSLTATASATQVGGGPGGFFTQADYSEIVRYAAERFITIVPEIDMPGHTNAMLISHPELSCGRDAPAPYTSIRVGFSALCPDKEDTYRLVDDVIRELAAITPGPYIHVGGDEVETLTREQYVRFVERVQDIVTRHGKRMIGWEEIAKARLLPGTVAQQWQSDSARNALQYGSRLVISAASRLYLDMKYDSTTELGLRWAGLLPVSRTYEWDPATHIAGVEEPDIIGIEAPLWAETIRNITAAQYLAMPRLASIAEVAWTPQANRSWPEFRYRLAGQARRWRLLGINYHPSPEIPW